MYGRPKLQALVYDILPSTTAVFSCCDLRIFAYHTVCQIEDTGEIQSPSRVTELKTSKSNLALLEFQLMISIIIIIDRFLYSAVSAPLWWILKKEKKKKKGYN